MALQEEFDKGYGVELVEIFTDINDLVEKTAIKDFRKEIIIRDLVYRKYLNRPKNNFKKIYIEKLVRPKIIAYCKKEKIDFDSACRKSDEIFVPHSDSFFWSYLTLKLIACDINLITQILNWNKKEYHKTEHHDRRIASKEKINKADATKWEEERSFLLLVEHIIYGTVVSWMPVTDKLRLRKIMKWVDINKDKKSNSGLKKSQQATVIGTKTENLESNLKKYGFFDLKLIKDLSRGSQAKLIELFINKELPYQIAMIDFLEFINQLKEHFTVKDKLCKCLSEILTSNHRSVKGNLNVLIPHSKENKQRYTAHLYKEAVKKDYQELK